MGVSGDSRRRQASGSNLRAARAARAAPFPAGFSPWALLVMGLGLLVGCGAPLYKEQRTARSGFALVLEGQPLVYWPEAPRLDAAAWRRSQNAWLSASDFQSPLSLGNNPSLPAIVGLSKAHSLLSLPNTGSQASCPGRVSLLRSFERMSLWEQRLQAPVSRVDRMALDRVFSTYSDLCELQQSFDCLQMTFESLPRSKGLGRLSRTLHPWVTLSPVFDACFRPVGYRQGPSNRHYFDIASGQLVFTPEKLLSILIYEGIFDSLATALVAGSPVATLPLSPFCEDGPSALSDLACRRSPVSVEACEGCEGLKLGTLYSAFLIEQAGLPDSALRPVLFSPVR